jgi:hypothetical protein
MKYIICIVLLFSFCSSAVIKDVCLKGNDGIDLSDGKGIEHVNFDFVINGYKVNCRGDKLIVWGKPKEFNEGNPQDTKVALVDINDGYKIYEKGLSSGVFDADYLNNGLGIYIGSGGGFIMDVVNGDLESIGGEFDASNDDNFESCDKNRSWEFNQYP